MLLVAGKKMSGWSEVEKESGPVPAAEVAPYTWAHRFLPQQAKKVSGGADARGTVSLPWLHLVARGRDLSLERVAEIAEGRVWIGSRAAEIGLVDTLGGRQAAIARAAELAGLEDYGVKPLAPPLSPRELLLRQLTGNAWTDGMARWLWNDGGAGTAAPLVRRLRETWDLVERLNDPQHSYALCLTCRIAAP